MVRLSFARGYTTKDRTKLYRSITAERFLPFSCYHLGRGTTRISPVYVKNGKVHNICWMNQLYKSPLLFLLLLLRGLRLSMTFPNLTGSTTPVSKLCSSCGDLFLSPRWVPTHDDSPLSISSDCCFNIHDYLQFKISLKPHVWYSLFCPLTVCFLQLFLTRTSVLNMDNNLLLGLSCRLCGKFQNKFKFKQN